MFRKKNKTKVQESHKALAEAHLHVQQSKGREVEVRQVAAGLREARRQNHFAEQIALLLGR